MVFSVTFSCAGTTNPPVKVEASDILGALDLAQKRVPTLERVEVTAIGGGVAYRFRRCGGEWQQLASHPIPELDSSVDGEETLS